MVGLPPLCTEADCNVKATAEITDSVNMIGIVTNAFSGNTVSALVLLLLQCSDFTVSPSQAVVLSFFSLINRSSLLPYLPADTHCSLCSKLIACKVDLWNGKAPQMLLYLCGTLYYFFSQQMFLVFIRKMMRTMQCFRILLVFQNVNSHFSGAH